MTDSMGDGVAINIETLTATLQEAQHLVNEADSTVAELISPMVYAIEYAEGSDGADIRHHLRTALLALRAAEALHLVAARRSGGSDAS